MPDTAPRPHVVALLCDADFTRRRDTHTWSHRDGRPFTKEEQTTAGTATRWDFEEVKEQMNRYNQYLQRKMEAPDALQDFLAPFMARLTHPTLGNAVQLMADDDRTQLDHLLSEVATPAKPFRPYTF
ncbi:hypothetical protein ACFV3R_00655 [Streptomyces sp. NPDC059740]|uniref:hypothetical protein n=1 Tax=Streptomyces sp. NPDC059740 TaxID=3346926 RepID=UPI003659682C